MFHTETLEDITSRKNRSNSKKQPADRRSFKSFTLINDFRSINEFMSSFGYFDLWFHRNGLITKEYTIPLSSQFNFVHISIWVHNSIRFKIKFNSSQFDQRKRLIVIPEKNSLI